MSERGLAGPISLAEAMARLASPSPNEEHAVLLGAPAFYVDADTEVAHPGEGAIAAARAALARLACPSVAVCRRPPEGTAADVLDRFDVVVGSVEQAAPVLEGVARAPIAATVLVQLLRLGERLSRDNALVAESLAYATLQAGPEFAAWRQTREGRPPPAPSLAPTVLVERSDERLTITLHRPEKHNALSVTMRDALVEALEVAVADPSIPEVVLSGAGPSFCSGGDLDEFGTLPDPATGHLVRTTRSIPALLVACAGRTHAIVHGACIGAGTELPAFARQVSARTSATFELPELGLGLVPGAGGTVSLPRRIGRQRTAWLALSGQRIDAPTALGWGLIDEILA